MEIVSAVKDLQLTLHETSPLMMEIVRSTEAFIKKLPQVEFETHHLFHGGMYCRTIEIPAGAVLVGALIKVPTIIVAAGRIEFTGENGPIEISGVNVLPGSAGRKQVFYAHTDSTLTMLFPTAARTVEEAELEFTDEVDALMSRHNKNIVIVTGE